MSYLVPLSYWSNYIFQLPLLGWIPKLRTAKFGLKTIETSLYRVVHKMFRCIEPFILQARIISVTERRTDRQNYDSNSVRLTTVGHLAAVRTVTRLLTVKTAMCLLVS